MLQRQTAPHHWLNPIRLLVHPPPIPPASAPLRLCARFPGNGIGGIAVGKGHCQERTDIVDLHIGLADAEEDLLVDTRGAKADRIHGEAVGVFHHQPAR